jgi:cytochrome c-type biogenesis protein CcmH
MMLWPILALMTAAALLAGIWPLVRQAGAMRSGSDIAVYRDQLEEVERDRTTGLIREPEAAAARVEISRRLLAAFEAAEATRPNVNAAAGRRRAVVVASLLVVPVVAGGLYLRLGSPQLASAQVMAQQGVPVADESIERLVEKVEAHLQRDPRDGRGWEILAPVYMQLNRYSDAVAAWRNALQLLGATAQREANLGEALTAEANGVVTAEAKAAFVRAVTLDETIVSARYYLGLAAEQDGQREKAATIWRDLIAQAPPGAHWLGDVRKALARVEGTSAPPAGPTAAQMAAAANEPPDQQAAMIHGMVDRLAARLKRDGSDVEGWVRLVRSYKVLRESEKAGDAAADAHKALAGDPDKLRQLEAALKDLDANSAAAGASAPEPDAAQIAARANELPEQQAAMIHSMVDRLAVRLKQDGSDVEGWVRLVRSYKVLGESEKARDAAADARKALAGDPDRLRQLEAALTDLDAIAAAAASASEPDAAQMAAAGAAADHQRGATIQTMVERLAERLRKSGSDPEGWLMLARSYVTLGETDKARAVIGEARQALAGEPDKLEQFNVAVKRYNIAD